MGNWGTRRAGAALVLLLCTVLAAWGCRAYQKGNAPERPPVLGIVCPASEDDWKDEQYRLIEEQAQAHGLDCMVMRTERTQQAQIDAIRALIVYRVDVIAFVPVVQSGWEHVLQEAQGADIPISTVDRGLQQSDGQRTASSVTFSYRAGAERAAEWMAAQGAGTAAELYGTLNALSAQEISRGFREALKGSRLELKYSLCGDYLRSRGREIMEMFVQEYPAVDWVLAQNDAMALGAIDCMKAFGLQPGRDIRLCVFGGGEEVRSCLARGEIDLVVQCDNAALAHETAHAALALLEHPETTVQHTVETVLLTGEGAV